MCLAVIGKVMERAEEYAWIDIEGNRLHVATLLVPEVQISDYVLIHAGIAISIVSQTDYEEHRRIFREIEKSAQQAIESD